MSGKSFTSGSFRSCGGSVRLGTTGGHDFVVDTLYERKSDKKTVRVLTVIVYVFCVSLAAIMLSLYYVFFWEPKDAHAAQRKVSETHTVVPQTTTTMFTCLPSDTGGSNITVKDSTTPQPTSNISHSVLDHWINNITVENPTSRQPTYNISSYVSQHGLSSNTVEEPTTAEPKENMNSHVSQRRLSSTLIEDITTPQPINNTSSNVSQHRIATKVQYLINLHINSDFNNVPNDNTNGTPRLNDT